MVENQGRINWAAPGDKGRLDAQRKGILGDIKLNGKILENWKMWSLSFNETMISAITGQKDWWTSNCQNPILPGLFKASLNVDEPKVRISLYSIDGATEQCLIFKLRIHSFNCPNGKRGLFSSMVSTLVAI